MDHFRHIYSRRAGAYHRMIVAEDGEGQLQTVLDLLGPDARHRTEGAQPGLGADAAAEGLAVEEARAQAVEEAQVLAGALAKKLATQ